MIDVQVEVPGSGPSDSADALAIDASEWPELVRRAVRAVFMRQGVEEAELSVTLLDDGPMRDLNREHLGHDHTTDVISFALYGEGEPVLGDVYVGWRQAIRQAEAEGVSVREEIARLAIHGTLHVLGFDHPEETAARPESDMYRLQESILTDLGAGAPASSGEPA